MYFPGMTGPRVSEAKEKLLRAGSELIRRQGFVGTSVDQICEEAGVTKGAFFHHFKSKEALAEECLCQWARQTAAMDETASYQKLTDPAERLLGCMDFYIHLFQEPKLIKSCLAGTTAQEVSETHPELREAANACFIGGARRFRTLVEEAGRARRKKVDGESLAQLWVATLQGAIILAKASRDHGVIGRSLEHVRRYIVTLLELE